VELSLNPAKKASRVYYSIECCGKKWEVSKEALDKEKQHNHTWPVRIAMCVLYYKSGLTFSPFTESLLESGVVNIEFYKMEEFPKRGVTKQWVKTVPLKE
jgi:hypothetical protein